MFGKNKKPVKHICRNCKLYDREDSVCNVVFVVNGEDYLLQTQPDDKCQIEENDLLEYVKTLGIWQEGNQRFIEYRDH